MHRFNRTNIWAFWVLDALKSIIYPSFCLLTIPIDVLKQQFWEKYKHSTHHLDDPRPILLRRSWEFHWTGDRICPYWSKNLEDVFKLVQDLCIDSIEQIFELFESKKR